MVATTLTQSRRGAGGDSVDLERDRALVERCQQGDTSAFDDLYLRYYQRLCRYCFRKLGNRAEAEDAAQEAFARAWRAMPRFDGERRFYPWLCVIASHLCVDMMRRSSRTTVIEDARLDLAARPVDGGLETRVEYEDDCQLLAQALARISPRYREVLQLREGEEWSYQRIADHQGVRVSTIETLLFRARSSLRRQFFLLADGEAGLAGFLLAARRLLGRNGSSAMRLVHRFARGAPASGAKGGIGTGLASSAGAGAPIGLGASAATGAGLGTAQIAAGLVATALAAGAIAAVAVFAPHPAAASPGAHQVGQVRPSASRSLAGAGAGGLTTPRMADRARSGGHLAISGPVSRAAARRRVAALPDVQGAPSVGGDAVTSTDNGLPAAIPDLRSVTQVVGTGRSVLSKTAGELKKEVAKLRLLRDVIRSTKNGATGGPLGGLVGGLVGGLSKTSPVGVSVPGL